MKFWAPDYIKYYEFATDTIINLSMLQAIPDEDNSKVH